MATFVHFNIDARDPEKTKGFYEKIFDWKIDKLPGPMEYYMITTQDLQGKPGIGGGISRGEEGGNIINYIGVASIDDTIKKIVQLGGTVLQPKQAVPGYGMLAVCTDPEKNIFGVFEENASSLKPS